MGRSGAEQEIKKSRANRKNGNIIALNEVAILACLGVIWVKDCEYPQAFSSRFKLYTLSLYSPNGKII